jgi:integrase
MQIDTPRVYRLERLPHAIPWNQVEALLSSIDRSEAHGVRDFTLLYLAAAYGLLGSELVRLTLDDIDWRGRTLQVLPRGKTGMRRSTPIGSALNEPPGLCPYRAPRADPAPVDRAYRNGSATLPAF